MLNVKKSLALATLAVAGLFSGAASHAALDVPAGGSAFQPFAGFVGQTTFNDSYSFTLGGLSNLTGFSFSSLLSGFQVSLKSGSTTLFTDTSPSSFGWSGLGAGAYSLNFSGVGQSKLFSGYGGAFTIRPAVPEPATLALGLMAAGLLGGLALRKRQTKR